MKILKHYWYINFFPHVNLKRHGFYSYQCSYVLINMIKYDVLFRNGIPVPKPDSQFVFAGHGVGVILIMLNNKLKNVLLKLYYLLKYVKG